MSDNTEKVVKCKKCDLYFGYTKKYPKCPFCHTKYEEVEKIMEKSIFGGKKWTAKARKKSFKMWGK